ncbi:MAG: DUF3318 domain-containing protein [Geminocystis sp.]|nr:DUF3318 domain-containing protein [Geminocystis sp.]HIK37266.1 DUF3318 domain-containing protein [Geminocystis sp. M7585_C2015_104]MCS7148223.1 DUF3318 domain-containing protein [Geminocystis sp.]MCX8077637.1 DUF3318 domain-containing protein [Geminocystis sp.]MDW8116529.1 DUF3318 domain-containing protein [Geminocystis sp.]
MNIEQEISRLQELMPASGRMFCKIFPKSQKEVISTIFPLPWQTGRRPIYINFELWRQLSTPQRDLLFLRTVALCLGVKWFKWDIERAVALVALLGFVFQLSQQDVVGIVVSGILFTFAAKQIWQQNRSLAREIEADAEGVKIALRRGYNEREATSFLVQAIEKAAELEGRFGLSFVELMRIQNLKKAAQALETTV